MRTGAIVRISRLDLRTGNKKKKNPDIWIVLNLQHFEFNCCPRLLSVTVFKSHQNQCGVGGRKGFILTYRLIVIIKGCQDGNSSRIFRRQDLELHPSDGP